MIPWNTCVKDYYPGRLSVMWFNSWMKLVWWILSIQWYCIGYMYMVNCLDAYDLMLN